MKSMRYIVHHTSSYSSIEISADVYLYRCSTTPMGRSRGRLISESNIRDLLGKSFVRSEELPKMISKMRYAQLRASLKKAVEI